MRIGVSTSVVQRGQTGVGQYVFALLRALLPQSTQHEFVLFVLKEDLALFDFASQKMRIVSVPERFRPPVKNILWHQTHLPKLAGQNQLDLLHVPSYRRLLWPRPCPLVGTIHDLAPFHVASKYDWKRMFYGRVVARTLAQRQDAIIAISENTARDVRRFFGVSSTRTTVIHNGIDHERFFPGDRDAAKTVVAKRFGLEGPFLLYVARLEHPAKNHVRLIAAFDKFKTAAGSDWRLVLGGSDWHGAEVIHAAIQRARFAADIRTLGFVPDATLPYLYRAAAAFVYPSLYEGFGLPPVEAMACGCPVIASTRGALGEVVGEAAAILEPEEVDSIAEQIKIVATDQKTRERLRLAGLARARKFDWKVTAEATMQVYERVRR